MEEIGGRDVILGLLDFMPGPPKVPCFGGFLLHKTSESQPKNIPLGVLVGGVFFVSAIPLKVFALMKS